MALRQTAAEIQSLRTHLELMSLGPGEQNMESSSARRELFPPNIYAVIHILSGFHHTWSGLSARPLTEHIPRECQTAACLNSSITLRTTIFLLNAGKHQGMS